MKVPVELETIELDGDYTMIESVCVTCSRCGQTAEAYGAEEDSERAACVMLHQACPRRERNFYFVLDEEDERTA